MHVQNFSTLLNMFRVQPMKEKVVKVWTDRIMHIWNTTKNRVEFAHSRLKKYLVISLGEICKNWKAI
jgi:alpha-glucosidase